MNFKYHYLAIIFTALIACSCGYEELPTQNVTKTPASLPSQGDKSVYKKKEPEHYNYKGDKFRDPFVAMTGETSSGSALSEEVAIPNLGSLKLKGIYDDGKIKMALISGGGINYILKGSRLYDNRQRLVRAISGVIRKRQRAYDCTRQND